MGSLTAAVLAASVIPLLTGAGTAIVVDMSMATATTPLQLLTAPMTCLFILYSIRLQDMTAYPILLLSLE